MLFVGEFLADLGGYLVGWWCDMAWDQGISEFTYSTFSPP